MLETLTTFVNLDSFQRISSSPPFTGVDSPTSGDKDAFMDDSHQDEAETTLLLKDRSQHDIVQSHSCRRRNQYIFLVAIFVAAVTILALIAGVSSNNRQHVVQKSHNGYTYLTLEPSPSKTNSKTHPCGTSAAEARSLNCTFDQLTWSWLPSSCTLYATSEFLSAESKPWVYWQDLDRTQQVQDSAWEEILDGERNVFGEKGEHLTHCIFMYLSLAQILRSGGTHWERLMGFEHHEHCAKMLLKEIRKGYGINVETIRRRGDEEMEKWGDGGWESLQTFMGGANFDQDCEGKVVHVAGRKSEAMEQDKSESVGSGYN